MTRNKTHGEGSEKETAFSMRAHSITTWDQGAREKGAVLGHSFLINLRHLLKRLFFLPQKSSYFCPSILLSSLPRHPFVITLFSHFFPWLLSSACFFLERCCCSLFPHQIINSHLSHLPLYLLCLLHVWHEVSTY